MDFLRRFYRRPQQLWIRQLNFQIHLWTGIVLALYVIVIAITGSVLVFRAELEHLARPWPWKHNGPATARVGVGRVIQNVEARYPRWLLTSIQAPVEQEPGFVAVLQSRTRIRVACDPDTGTILGELPPGPQWLRVIQDLHETLLFGAKGRMVNGIGGAFLVLMCATGLVLWWPGVKNWRRGFLVDFRRSWQRINFDLHSAVGFWMLLLVSFWGASGIYFAFPRPIILWVNSLSPIVNSKPPRISVTPRDSEADVSEMVRQAGLLDPSAKWKGIRLPFGPRAPLQVVMGRSGGEGDDYEDILFFDPTRTRFGNVALGRQPHFRRLVDLDPRTHPFRYVLGPRRKDPLVGFGALDSASRLNRNPDVLGIALSRRNGGLSAGLVTKR